MKRYITYIIAILSLAYVASCTKTDDIANPNDSGRMTLLLQSSIMTRSADDTAGLNEDVVSSVDCYFYPANSSADANAVWHCKVTSTPVSEGSGSYKIENIDMKSGDITKVFPNGSTTAKVYIIANYPGNDLPTAEANNLSTDDGSSIATLKAKIIQQTWGGENPSFVMDSDGTATVTKDGSAVSNGTTPIYLTRAAAKIELTITSVKSEVKGADGCTYVPALGDTGENIGITMHNAAIKSWIDNAWDANNSKLAYTSDSYESFKGYTFAKSQIVDGKQQYKQTVPFYSYPTHWGQGSTSAEAYLLLVVKWKKTKDENGNSVANASPQPCYYEIPIGQLDKQNNVVSEYIERNHHYQISIDVGTLGSFVKEDPVTLSPLYMVVDWTSGEITAQLTEKRYLVVDDDEIEVSNKDVCSVKYASSHDVAASITSIEFYDLTSDDAELQIIKDFEISEDGKVYRFTYSGREYEFKLSWDNGVLSVTHILQNNKDLDNFDYVPYTIYVNIHHDNDFSTTFNEDVKFIQYPAMYITAYQNPDFKDDSDDNKHKGYMFVNGYTGDDSRTSYPNGYKTVNSVRVQCLGSANGLTGSNKNPNSYLLTISSFSDPNGTYVIGDPRTSEIDTSLRDATFNTNGSSKTIWVSATALDGTTRTLMYPYPTRATADTKNMIAPQIRVASSYSVLSHDFVTQKEIARRRCASYQEAGYPAGRWRLPTKAEAEYMVKLSAEGLIPALFTSEASYWCAHGYFIPYNESTDNHQAGDVVYTESDTNGGASVRCVYDVWYWGDGRISNISTFTWGDQPR